MQIRKQLCWLTIILFWLAGCSQVQENVREEVTDGTKTSVAEEVKTEIVARDQEEKSKVTPPASPVVKGDKLSDQEVKVPAVKGDQSKGAPSPVVEKPAAVGKTVVAEQPKAIITTTPEVKAIPKTVTKTESPKPAVPVSGAVVGSGEKTKAPAVKGDNLKEIPPSVAAKPAVGQTVVAEKPKAIITTPAVKAIPEIVTKTNTPKPAIQAPVAVGSSEQRVVKAPTVVMNTSPGNNSQRKVEDKTTLPTVMKVPSVEEILKRASDSYDKKDFVNAVVWYQRAADQRVSKAQYRLGEMYYNGEGVSRNFVQAEKWYRQAAEQGDALAQYRLGKLYYAVEDYFQAIQWFTKSAQQEVAEAQKMLGRMYYQGQGTSQQFKAAFFWSLKAAEQGLADAQNNVALMYFKGEGVERDYIRSYQWVSLAVAQGNQEAIKARDVFIAKISPAQLSEGERLAREWAAKHPAKK